MLLTIAGLGVRKRNLIIEKLDGKILDLMTEFEDMDIDKEMRNASKLRADTHLGMIQIDEALANMTPVT